MGRALVLLLVAVASGLLVYWLAAPRFLSPANTAPGTVAATGPAMASSPSGSELPNTASAPAVIPAPRTPQQQARDALEAQRAPFYARLRVLGPNLEAFRSAEDDPATLELYAARDDPQLVSQWLAQIVQPDAYRYGFRHVRFFLPGSPDGVERYRLDSEASLDDQGLWHAFRK